MNIRKITTTRYIDSDTGQEYQFDPVEGTITIESTDTGYKMKYLTQDNNPISPQEDFEDSNCFLVHYHRDFQVSHDIVTKDILKEWYQGSNPEVLKEYYVFPVTALIHSGVWLKLDRNGFSEDPGGWDTSHVGAILVKKTKFGRGGVQFEHTEDKAKTIAENLLETWNQYLLGEVYCCVVEYLNDKKKMTDYDICSNFYELEYAKEQLKTEF
jgi:hypothetical protein